uniref:Uncharacterized protein n=1 Tax=Amphiprion ocellaris TaxID=80972 RepID=A0AAQ5X6H3_AMPOC
RSGCVDNQARSIFPFGIKSAVYLQELVKHTDITRTRGNLPNMLKTQSNLFTYTGHLTTAPGHSRLRPMWSPTPQVCGGHAPQVCWGPAPQVCGGHAPQVCGGHAPQVCGGHAPQVCGGPAPQVCGGPAPQVCGGPTPKVCGGPTPQVCRGPTPQVCRGHTPQKQVKPIRGAHNHKGKK